MQEIGAFHHVKMEGFFKLIVSEGSRAVDRGVAKIVPADDPVENLLELVQIDDPLEFQVPYLLQAIQAGFVMSFFERPRDLFPVSKKQKGTAVDLEPADLPGFSGCEPGGRGPGREVSKRQHGSRKHPLERLDGMPCERVAQIGWTDPGLIFRLFGSGDDESPTLGGGGQSQQTVDLAVLGTRQDQDGVEPAKIARIPLASKPRSLKSRGPGTLFGEPKPFSPKTVVVQDEMRFGPSEDINIHKRSLNGPLLWAAEAVAWRMMRHGKELVLVGLEWR